MDTNTNLFIIICSTLICSIVLSIYVFFIKNNNNNIPSPSPSPPDPSPSPSPSNKCPFGSFKSTYFDIMGGFDTQFRCSREDSDFIIRLKAGNVETLQTWDASVYHYTCVSSRGTDWYKDDSQAEIKNQWQSYADQEELKRFIRKWGYFGHDYRPKYDVTLFIDINTFRGIK